MLLTDAFLEYLLYEKNYSPKTVEAYKADILELQQYAEDNIGSVSPTGVDVTLIREWVTSLMESGRASSSVNRKLSSLRTYFKFLLRRGVVAVDPVSRVVGPKKGKQLPVFLKESQMDALLDEVNFGEGFEGCRDRLIIEVFYATGVRLSELLGIGLKDVDFTNHLLKVTGKRNKQRLVPFGDELMQSIQQYVDKCGEKNFDVTTSLFVTAKGEPISRSKVSAIVNRNVSRVATLKKRSPHVLRHTFATAMMNNGADLSSIKELLGHESLTTTQIYTHTTFEELKKVYNQAHPRV